MGIQGLLPLLKSITTPDVHVKKCATCYCLYFSTYFNVFLRP